MNDLPLPPEGYVYRWEPAGAESNWSLDRATFAGKTCRFTTGPGHSVCGQPAVVALKRGRGGWWAYCGEHMYGRRIRGGVVETRSLVPEGTA